MVEPRQALPRRRPRICLRYLTFFGINIASHLGPAGPLGGSDLRQPQPVLRAHPALELALVNPALHADLPVGRARLGESVVDVGPQRVQGQLTLQVPLRAGDLGAPQAAGDAQLDALGAEAHRRLDRLLHRPAEGHAPFHLQPHRLRHQLRLQLGLVDLHDVDEDLPAGLLLQVVAQLVHLGALAADDDPRARRVDVDLELVRGALDVDARHARVRQPLLQLGAQIHSLVQQLRVVLLVEPARLPGPVVAEPEAVRMDLLTHAVTSPFDASFPIPQPSGPSGRSRSSVPIARRPPGARRPCGAWGPPPRPPRTRSRPRPASPWAAGPGGAAA